MLLCCYLRSLDGIDENTILRSLWFLKAANAIIAAVGAHESMSSIGRSFLMPILELMNQSTYDPTSAESLSNFRIVCSLPEYTPHASILLQAYLTKFVAPEFALLKRVNRPHKMSLELLSSIGDLCSPLVLPACHESTSSAAVSATSAAAAVTEATTAAVSTTSAAAVTEATTTAVSTTLLAAVSATLSAAVSATLSAAVSATSSAAVTATSAAAVTKATTLAAIAASAKAASVDINVAKSQRENMMILNRSAVEILFKAFQQDLHVNDVRVVIHSILMGDEAIGLRFLQLFLDRVAVDIGKEFAMGRVSNAEIDLCMAFESVGTVDAIKELFTQAEVSADVSVSSYSRFNIFVHVARAKALLRRYCGSIYDAFKVSRSGAINFPKVPLVLENMLQKILSPQIFVLTSLLHFGGKSALIQYLRQPAVPVVPFGSDIVDPSAAKIKSLDPFGMLCDYTSYSAACGAVIQVTNKHSLAS